jgi:hypothetical protein
MQASATIAQWLQVPAQKRNLAKVMRRKTNPTTEVNHIEETRNRKTTAMRCHIRIKGNPVVAILDSGAAVSIITAKLMKKLGLQIEGPSKTIVVTANGTRDKALGIIRDVKITVNDIIIPVNLQVIDSRDETLLLRTDWFNKARAKLDFENSTLNVRYLGRTTTLNATHIGPTFMPIIEELEDNEDEDEWIEDEEDEDEYETFYVEEWPSVANELYYNPWLQTENTPAYYLTEIVNEEEVLTTQQTIKSNDKLTDDQHYQGYKLLENNIEIFAENILEEGQTKDLGLTNAITHEINTGNNLPIKKRAYRCSPDELEFLEKEIENMKKKNIIRESFGSWAFPVVIVPKKNGKSRLCVDYRPLNGITDKDVYPLLTINKILNKFNGAK